MRQVKISQINTQKSFQPSTKPFERETDRNEESTKQKKPKM
jgi:hypothetical protein